MKIGFIGLGNVGGKLSESLLRNKFNLTVLDLDTNLVKDFVSKGSKSAKSPKEELAKKTFFIEVEKKKYEATLQTQPLHDPENKIIKS